MSIQSINIANYEQYVLEYFDGELDLNTMLEFEHFLDSNPNIKSELSDFQNIKVTSPLNITYQNKRSLYKRRSNAILGLLVFVILGISSFVFLDYFATDITPTEPSQNSVIQTTGPIANNQGLDNQAVELNNNQVIVTNPKSDIPADYVASKTESSSKKALIKESIKAASTGVITNVPNRSVLTESSILESQIMPIVDVQKTPEMKKEIPSEIITIQKRDILVLEPLQINSKSTITVASIEDIYIRKDNLQERFKYTYTKPSMNKKAMFGKLAFANVTFSLLPTYLDNKND